MAILISLVLPSILILNFCFRNCPDKMEINVNKQLVATLILSIFSTTPLIADNSNTLSPTIITQESGDSALGFDFNYKKDFFKSGAGDSTAGTSISLPKDDILKEGFFSAKGSVSLNSDVLPKELINLNVGYKRLKVYQDKVFLGVFDAAQLGIRATHETNQDLDQSRTSGGFFGIASYGGTDFHYAIGLGGDYLISDRDEERRALVIDDNYWRLRGEINIGYKIDAGAQNLLLAWNYRYFRELDAPTIVANAGLDSHKLSNVKLTFLNSKNRDIFMSYSTGRLPFDHAEDRVYKIGFDYKF